MGQVSAESMTRPKSTEVTHAIPTPYVFAVIENIAVQAFVDTGSEISLISETLRMSVPSLMSKPIQKSFLLAKSVTGDYLDTLGMLPITIRLGEEVFSHDVQVVRNATQPVILGWDFLNRHHAIIDLRENHLKLWNCTVPLLCSHDIVPLKSSAVTLEPILIPARSQMNVLAKIQPKSGETEFTYNYVGLLDPDTQTVPGLYVARTVTAVKAGVTCVRAMNLTCEDCHVPCGTRLGEFHSLVTQPGEEYTMPEPTVAQIQTQSEPCPKPKLDLSRSTLDREQQIQLETLISKYSDVFSANEHDYGRTDLVKHTIRTEGAQPIRQRAYRTSPSIRAEIDKQVQQLLSHDVIEESCSPWASPVVLVKKRDGSYRFCIDFRKLNAVTVKDSYPLPRPSDALDSLSGACWFSTMDLSSGYWQVELDPSDREKTAFNTGSGLYQFKVLPMGLTNAPPTFQRLMELVLRGLHWKLCLVYLDDVLVFSRTFSEHLSGLEEVFSRFRSAGLKLKGSKCHFACSEVSYLGHVVCRQGLRPDERNLEKVRSWPTPRTVTEVRAFVGLCSYYRKFVKNFAVVAAPLHALTQKGAVFKWSSECEEAFRSLKHALTSPPIVAHPIFTQPFLLYTDASQDCVGSVLAQIQDQKERVIAYASHALTTSEKKWSTYDRELWAVVWSIRHFKHFLSGIPFKLITDHKPLLNLKTASVDTDPTGRRARWILELQVYDFTILHREGKQHSNADSLSRRPSSPVTETKAVQCVISSHTAAERVSFAEVPKCYGVLPDTSPTLSVDLVELQAQQKADFCLSTVIDWKENGDQRPPLGRLKRSPATLRKLWHEFPKLSVQDGVLCRRVKSSPHSPPSYQVVLPEVLILTALKCFHGEKFSGHLSAERTLLRARKICYWPYMSNDIQKFCAECVSCQLCSSTTHHERAPLQSINAERPFQRIAADITELPVTTLGNRYVLVVMDYFTRFVNLYPLKDQRATTVAQCIFEDYIKQHGVPEVIHTDQGRQFESDLIKHLCSQLGIEKTRTSPYHPQCDGMVERLNRTLKQQLSKYICESGGEWDRYLPQVELAYNSSVHSSTGFSPFFLAHGREPRLPADILLNCSPAFTSCTPGTPADYARDVTTRLSYAFKDAAEQSAAAKLSQKQQYDKKTFFHPHKPGDFVFLDDPAQKQNKLAPKWKGPFKILRRLDKGDNPGVTYEITDPQNQQSRKWVVHHNRLKPCKGSFQHLPAPTVPVLGPTVVDGDKAPHSVPLTALSGALPFRPSTPPYVPNKSEKLNACGSRTECQSQTLSSSDSDLMPRPSVSPTVAQVPEQVISVDPLQQTRSGRVVKKPVKLNDFVC